jgi:hypothetical protein
MPEDLLQNRDNGPRQNGSGGKCVAQIVEVHGPAQSQAFADAIMGFADGTKMGTGLPGTRKNPVVVGLFLPAFLQEFEDFLTHRQSTFGVCGLPTHDQDRSVEEVQVRIGHSKDFIRPHSLAENDYGDALEGLGGTC